MSLTSLLRSDLIAREIVDSFIRPGPRRMELATTIPSRDKRNAALIGTAVDYAIRIELKRRFPNAKERAWIAENARAQDEVPNGPKIVRGAKRFAEKYQSQLHGEPSNKIGRELARRCLGLAELDFAYRSPTEYVGVDVSEESIDEVSQIFRTCPWEKLLALQQKRRILLNPAFGAFSEILGGVDADLIVGQTLIEIKTVSRPSLDRPVLRQLAGYLFCVCGCLATNVDIPPINSVGVLFTRQSDLWIAPVEEVFEMRNVSKLGRQFFDRARQVRKEREKSLQALRAIVGTDYVPRRI